jgi:hypothetical protein
MMCEQMDKSKHLYKHDSLDDALSSMFSRGSENNLKFLFHTYEIIHISP